MRNAIFLLVIGLTGLGFLLAPQFPHLFRMDELRHFDVSPPLHLNLEIAPQDMERLNVVRKKAKERGFLLKEEHFYVPAYASDWTTKVKALIRLKGDLSDHWDSEQFSLRVDIQNRLTWNEYSQFSLQHPSTRHYLAAWMFQRHLKHEGILGVGAEFIRFTLNQNYMGVYLLEEHFSKAFLRNRNKEDGPILKLDEAPMWKEVFHFNDSTSGLLESEGKRERDIRGAGISVYGGGRFSEDLKIEATNALYSLIHGIQSPSEVLDIEKMAKYLALLDLYGAGHAASWHNLRFYFDPKSKKLEPVGFDSDYQRMRHILGISGSWTQSPVPFPDPWLKLLFSDKALLSTYVKELNRLIGSAAIQEFLALCDAELGEHLDIVREDWARFGFDEDVLMDNRSWIARQLDPIRLLDVWLQEVSPQRLCFYYRSVFALPVRIEGIEVEGLPYTGLQRPLELSPRELGTRSPVLGPICQKAPGQFVFPPESVLKAKVRARVIGHPQSKTVVLNRESPPVLQKDRPGQIPDWIQFSGHIARVKEGSYLLSEPLVLPDGISLHVDAGTEIRMQAQGLIVAQGPIHFHGEPDKTVKLINQDSPNGGLLVINAQSLSTLKHVKFLGLEEPMFEGRSYTGGVSFSRSGFYMEETVFKQSRSQYALQVIRSSFDGNRVQIINSQFNGLAVDYSSGVLRQSDLTGNASIGISVSGSQIRLEFVKVAGSAAHCVRAQDNSELFVLDSGFLGCRLGLSAYDSTRVQLERVSFRDHEVAISAFVSKEGYGVPEVFGRHLIMDSVKREAVSEEGALVEYELARGD
ncbi:MAG: CotH kinase family protein [Candidatus Cloacimonetes bacterium]|nr:CotH kinase family protein [Candidatus Cloacimonadota bacterium]